MDEGRLEVSVRAQAEALVADDMATFSSYCTPQALLQFGDVFGRAGRVRAFEIVDVTAAVDGVGGTSRVRYDGDGACVVRQRWQRDGDAWKTVAAEREDGAGRRGRLARLFGRKPQ
jgi:hypothetical protein